MRMNLVLWMGALAAAQEAAVAAVEPCQKFAHELLEGRSRTTLENPYDYAMNVLVDAETAHQCAKSIPIPNEEAASVFGHFKESLWMYSTLAFMKNPPESYQQPAVDVHARLDELTDKARHGKYFNFFEYISDLQALNRDTHDGHFSLRNGGMFSFRWSLPHDIVSVSSDGKEIPQVYVHDDIMNNESLASPIVEFAGESVISYLEKYIKEKSDARLLEPHAEWNTLMYSAATQFGTWGCHNTSSVSPSGFRSTWSYNGKSLSGKFANGTEFEWPYMASSKLVYNTTKLTGPQAFFDTWILEDQRSESLRKKVTDEDKQMEQLFSAKTTAFDPLPAVPDASFPDDPVVVQGNFSRGGTVSGYLLDNNSIGVLSIPSFMPGNTTLASREFHSTIADFIAKSRQAGVKKVVIDVSGNGGGYLFLGYDTFRQFFPQKDPFILANSRASPELNTLGSVLTQIGNGISGKLPGINQTVAQRNGVGDLGTHSVVTKDGNRWGSWKDMFGPVAAHGDHFTQPWRYDFSSLRILTEFEFNLTGYGDNTRDYEQAFDPADVIILQDGQCGSTCSVFSSLMKNIAGVKSVAVGGVPSVGPMQGVAGTRGCLVRNSQIMGKVAQVVRDGLVDSHNQSRQAMRDELGVSLDELLALHTDQGLPWHDVAASLNTVNCLSPSHPDVPHHFLYEASNCRLFYTADMVRDVKKLWEAVARVAGGDTSACVPGSVDGPGSGQNGALVGSPGFSGADVWRSASDAIDIFSGRSQVELVVFELAVVLVIAWLL